MNEPLTAYEQLDLDRRKIRAFNWLLSVADSPVGWGTHHLHSLRDCWISGMTLLDFIEAKEAFQQWVRDQKVPE